VSSKAKEAERKTALRKLELAMNVTDDLERRMGLTERWTSDSEEYRSAAAYLDNRQFIRAVDELEGLVVQRLFELLKAHLAGTGEYSTECLLQYTKRNACIGYKLRKHISKAIVRRSKAVRASLDRYNQLAPLQSPPCPVLEYSDVASYRWLGDFILLKMSRHGILKQPWAVSTNREIARKSSKYFVPRRKSTGFISRSSDCRHGLMMRSTKSIVAQKRCVRRIHCCQLRSTYGTLSRVESIACIELAFDPSICFLGTLVLFQQSLRSLLQMMLISTSRIFGRWMMIR
jgi:hypothetical protein